LLESSQAAVKQKGIILASNVSRTYYNMTFMRVLEVYRHAFSIFPLMYISGRGVPTVLYVPNKCSEIVFVSIVFYTFSFSISRLKLFV